MLIGKWKLKGVVEIDAKIKVRRVFGGKADGGYMSVVQVIDPASGVVLDELNGPHAPYVPGEDALTIAYAALQRAFPALEEDQEVEVSQKILDALEALHKPAAPAPAPVPVSDAVVAQSAPEKLSLFARFIAFIKRLFGG